MMERKATAMWEGDLKGGKGKLKLGTGAFEGAYSFKSRFEGSGDTNPEELIGAAHAGCFSMALTSALVKAGFEPKRVKTDAKVFLNQVDQIFNISKVELMTEAEVPKIDETKFLALAESARKDCIVSRALTGVNTTLSAKLVG